MPLFDFNSFLLPKAKDASANAETTAQIITFLSEKYGVTRYHLMPLFDCAEDTVPIFLLKRDRAISELQAELSSKSIQLHFGATAILQPDLWQIAELERLCYGNTRILPLRFPLGPYQDWMDQELNHLLYHGDYSLLFTDFEFPLLFFDHDTIEKILRIQGAIFHFNYRGFLQPQVQEIIKALIAKQIPVLFGTDLSSMEKAYYYELDHYLNVANNLLSPTECQRLWAQNHSFWKKSN